MSNVRVYKVEDLMVAGRRAEGEDWEQVMDEVQTWFRDAPHELREELNSLRGNPGMDDRYLENSLGLRVNY